MPPATMRRVIAGLQIFFGGSNYPALRIQFLKLRQLVSDGLAVVVRLVAVDQADQRVLDRVTAELVHTVVEFLGTLTQQPRLGEMLGKRTVIWQAFGPYVRVQAGRQRVQSARPYPEQQGDERARATHTTETG